MHYYPLVVYIFDIPGMQVMQDSTRPPVLRESVHRTHHTPSTHLVPCNSVEVAIN